MTKSPIRTAIILAAGRGSRLGSDADGGVSKALIELGGETLIDFQVRQLRRAGIENLVVVTGFKDDEVRAHLAPHGAKFVHNPVYATTNSLYSLSLAAEWGRGGALVMNSDVVFHFDLLERLLGDAAPNGILVDFVRELGEEEMKVAVEGGVVAAISKELPSAPGQGENVGLVKIGPADASAFFDEAARILAEGNLRAWAPYCIQRLVGKVPFGAVPVGETPWTEIDFPEDLENARREIYPKCR